MSLTAVVFYPMVCLDRVPATFIANPLPLSSMTGLGLVGHSKSYATLCDEQQPFFIVGLAMLSVKARFVTLGIYRSPKC